MRRREIIKGLVISLGTTVAIFCMTALLYSYTDITEDFTPIILKITVLMSVALGSFISGKNMKSKGWLNGISIGFMYTMGICLIGAYLKNDIWFITKKIEPLLINMFIATFCGVVGVNAKGAVKKL